MKKLLAIFMVVLTVLAFSACAGNQPVDSGKVTIVEYVAEGDDVEYVVELSSVENAQSLLDVLLYLKNSRNVTLVYSESETGAFLTAFGSLAQDADKGLYLYYWTSIESDWDNEWGTEKTVKETKLVSSGVSVSSAKLEDGAIYYFGYYGY